MNKPVGLYIHVPFCLSKCPYCDFYSVRYSRSLAAEYSEALIRNIKHYGARYDSVYFGGGTPILIYEHIADNLAAADIEDGAEITVEANPCAVTEKTAGVLARAGAGRVSLGVQSMDKRELHLLGRRHTPEQVTDAVRYLHNAGIYNVSADMMIGLPWQDESRISDTARTLESLGFTHISAYILKIEEGTDFALSKPELPDDDRTAELYLHTVSCLEEFGYAQYEISNFSRPGYESRHNLKYWRCREYIGIGAAAHSCYNGQRFCVPRDVYGFIHSPVQQVTVTDDDAGEWEEYAMLKLRLTEGLTFAEADKFGKAELLRSNMKRVPGNLLKCDPDRVSLTPEGFIISNSVISELIF